MRGTIVGVLRGGPSREHDISLASGHAIISALPTDRYTVHDIYIAKDGTWHERGLPTTPSKALRAIDVVVNGLHGEYGEDGEVQKVLELHGVPYTGSDSFASFVAMHKVLAKEKARELGLLTPRYRFIQEDSDIDEILRDVVQNFTHPVIVKPVRWGSSVGMGLYTGYAPIHSAATSLLRDGAGGVLVEEFVRGREATAGIVEGMRGEALYELPIVEIIPPEGADFFNRENKYDGTSRELCPSSFPKQISAELSRQARVMHEALGLRHYSHSDFIVAPKGIYYLETNTLPGLTNESLLPKSLAAVGVTFPDFLSHLIDLALDGKKR